MKKFRLVLFIFFISITLISCGADKNPNDDLGKEEVIEKTRESFESLNSLHQDVSMELISTRNNQEQTQIVEMTVDMIYDDDKNISNIHTTTRNIANNQTKEVEFYRNEDNSYINQGNGWTRANGEEDYSTTYKPMLDSFLDISDDLEMEEKEEEYIFTFKGKDTRIYRIMGVPYNIRYSGINEKDIDLDLKYVIEKENMFLSEIIIETLGKVNEDNKIQINVDVELEDFNQKDEIEVPDDIGNTASIK